MTSSPLLSETSLDVIETQRLIPEYLHKAVFHINTLASHLPTGTLLAFNFLIPFFTSDGSCDHTNHVLTIVLLTLLSFSCFFSPFTDSVGDGNGNFYYGVATFNGLWFFYCPDSLSVPDLHEYRMRFIDWIHSVLSVLVFFSVAMMNNNVVTCFFPAPDKETKLVLKIVLFGVGSICSWMFSLFPKTRHGMGRQRDG